MSDEPALSSGASTPRSGNRSRRNSNASTEETENHFESGEPSARRSLGVAVWEVGHLLNHLHFRLQQAWLLPGRQQVDRAIELWDTFTLAVRGLFPTITEMDERHQRIVVARREWLAVLDTEWRAESLFAADAELAQCLSRGGADRSDDAIQRDVCLPLLHVVHKTIEQLRQAVELGLDESLVRLLRLAEVVDRGLHPTDDVGHFFRPPDKIDTDIEGVETNHQSQTEAEESEGASRQPSTPVSPDEPSCSPWTIVADHVVHSVERPTYAHEVVVRPLDSLWLQEIVCRWAEIGFPREDILNAVGANDPPRELDTRRTVTAIDEAVRRVAVVLRAAPVSQQRGEASLDASQNEALDPGYLGLILNSDNHEVQRQNWESSITIRGTVRWALFKFFVQRRRNFTSRRELLRRWEAFGGDDVVNDNRVDDVICCLRRDLQPIGITIENSRGVGWRIAESSSLQASSSSRS